MTVNHGVDVCDAPQTQRTYSSSTRRRPRSQVVVESRRDRYDGETKRHRIQCNIKPVLDQSQFSLRSVLVSSLSVQYVVMVDANLLFTTVSVG